MTNMTDMMEEDDTPGQTDNSGQAQQQATPPTGVNQQQAMGIIQTHATQFTQGVVQNIGPQQSIGQIITNYSSASSSSFLVSSSSSSHTTSMAMEISSPEELEKDKPKFLCVVCQDEFVAEQIMFTCTCPQGKVCVKCMPTVVSTWKANALTDCGLTIDTGHQVYFVSEKYILSCPICKKAISPAAYDPTLIWYKKPSFPPDENGIYAAISFDFTIANVGVHGFRNGFRNARFFNDYPAYLQDKTQLTGDCPHCGNGNGRYVRIKAKDAATYGKKPWGKDRPSCLICVSDPPFGPDDDLLFCCICQQSILHTKHDRGNGQVQTGTFYTEVFKL